jgi:beta-glucanase (GH16 family)
MGLHRARGVALTVLALVAGTAVLGIESPATAASAAAPSVSLRQSADGAVTVSGRTASASPRVRFARATSSGWSPVKRIRAHHHRYATRLAVAPGATARFKVTADHRSRSFVVRAPAVTTASKTVSKPTQYDACGARPLKADGTAWSCTFDDEFSGTTVDRTKWLPQTVFTTGSPDAYACYVDDPHNVSVADGMLSLTVRKVAAPVPCPAYSPTASTVYTAGSVSTYHLFSQQYGRFEARILSQATTGPGLHDAFWLWPDDRVASSVLWPAAGEIDITENYSYYPGLAIPFLHYSADAGGPQPGVNTAWNCEAWRGQWNTYTLEWTPTRLEILVNGRSCLVNTSADPAFQKPYIAALTAGLGVDANALTDDSRLPSTMKVDYLRVWR